MPAPTTHDLVFGWNGLTLAGSLHLPVGKAPHPAVLMMQGSGPADRDCDGYFALIREAFLTKGIASFAFDKPGCGESSGEWQDYGLNDRASQASAALALLKSHHAIDGPRVGVWGQSQGGWLAQLVAGSTPDLCFAIANSGPSITVAEQDLYACEHTMRSQGHDDAAIDEALSFVRDVHEAALLAVDYATVDVEILQEARQKPWYGSYFTTDTTEDWAFVKLVMGERYEPRDALSKIQCPFLAIYGALDTLVPAWRGAEESGQALQMAGNADSTIVVFPNADHRIQDQHTRQFATGYLELLGDWTASRVRL